MKKTVAEVIREYENQFFVVVDGAGYWWEVNSVNGELVGTTELYNEMTENIANYKVKNVEIAREGFVVIHLGKVLKHKEREE